MSERSPMMWAIKLLTLINYKMNPTELWGKCNPSAQIERKGSPEIDVECISSQIGGVFLWGDSHMGHCLPDYD
jgi:hypothetical protein